MQHPVFDVGDLVDPRRTNWRVQLKLPLLGVVNRGIGDDIAVRRSVGARIMRQQKIRVLLMRSDKLLSLDPELTPNFDNEMFFGRWKCLLAMKEIYEARLRGDEHALKYMLGTMEISVPGSTHNVIR